jgi:hypothetical protein
VIIDFKAAARHSLWHGCCLVTGHRAMHPTNPSANFFKLSPAPLHSALRPNCTRNVSSTLSHSCRPADGAPRPCPAHLHHLFRAPYVTHKLSYDPRTDRIAGDAPKKSEEVPEKIPIAEKVPEGSNPPSLLAGYKTIDRTFGIPHPDERDNR